MLSRTKYVIQFFLPSYLLYIYVSIGQAFGGYLATNNYGWNKAFITDYFLVSNMQIIIFYLLIINSFLFIITLYFLLKTSQSSPHVVCIENSKKTKGLCLVAFICISFLQEPWVFSVQLAIIIFFINSTSLLAQKSRFLYYFFFTTTMLFFNYESKREIVMVLMAVLFVEVHSRRTKFNLTVTSFLIYSAILAIFIVFVLVASIMRGYGNIENKDLLSSLQYLPQYIQTETFVDSLSDNFELGYNYIVSILSIDFVLNARIDFQYGITFLKTLFLPFPRDIFYMKPDNIMIIFTKEYDYGFYSIGGSYPINLSSEFFINFHLFGAILFAIMLYYFNVVLLRIDKFRLGSFYYLYSMFFLIIFFIFMRGSGLDLFVFCLITGGTTLAILSISSGRLKIK